MRANAFAVGTRLVITMMLLAAAASSNAASTEPYAAYAYPAGGRAGTSIRIVVAGQLLKGASDVLVTGSGVRAIVLAYVGTGGPLNSVQEEYLKYRLDALSKEKSGAAAATAAPAASATPKNPPAEVELPDLPDLRDLEKKTLGELKLLYSRYIDRSTRPKAPMNETVEIALVIDESATPGARELRVLAAGGLSNPIAFHVGSLPEYLEPDRFDPPPATVPAPLSAPIVVNGRVMPGETDSHRIALRAGQEVLCVASARSLIPYLADAVPGWFQAVMSISDAEGKELAYCDDLGNDPDPAIRFKAPADGTYTISIRDSIYRGRFDFVYRIEVASPQAATKASTAAKASTAPKASALRTATISKPGEVDSYGFKGKAGEIVVAETRAARDGSPLDTIIRLVGPKGRLIALNDDYTDETAGLVTRQSDSFLMATLPEAGSYSIKVTDATGRGGPDYAYSLRMGPPEPGFSAITESSTINLPQYGSGLFTVRLVKKDAWDGDVEIALKNPLPGFSIEGGFIPKGSNEARMTLSFSGNAPAIPVEIELEARAVVAGKALSIPVRAADRVMQAFAYYHYVPAERLHVAFAKTRGKTTDIALPANALELSQGGSVAIEVAVSPKPAYPIELELVDPPAGLRLTETKPSARGYSISIAADPGAPLGAVNLIIRAIGITQAKDKSGAPIEQRIELGFLPALRVSIAKPR